MIFSDMLRTLIHLRKIVDNIGKIKPGDKYSHKSRTFAKNRRQQIKEAHVKKLRKNAKRKRR